MVERETGLEPATTCLEGRSIRSDYLTNCQVLPPSHDAQAKANRAEDSRVDLISKKDVGHLGIDKHTERTIIALV